MCAGFTVFTVRYETSQDIKRKCIIHKKNKANKKNVIKYTNTYKVELSLLLEI